MQIINKITGRDVTKEMNGLLEGLTMTPSRDEEIQVPCSAEQDWAWYYESE